MEASNLNLSPMEDEKTELFPLEVGIQDGKRLCISLSQETRNLARIGRIVSKSLIESEKILTSQTGTWSLMKAE